MDGVPEPPVVLRRLREETHDLHVRVERHTLLAPLIRGPLTREQYAVILEAFLAFYRTLEPALCAPAALPRWLRRSGYRYIPRCPLLARDLEGVAPERLACRKQGVPATLEFPTAEAVTGTLYVVEGATQGGRILAPRVQEQSGAGSAAASRYMNLYREDQWRLFQLGLASVPTDLDVHQVAAAGRRTFERLHRYLDSAA